MLRSTLVETDVFPGFSTDWQQPFAVLLTQSDGISVIHETVYEDRFAYLRGLNDLGAKTQLTTHCFGKVACRYRGGAHAHTALVLGPTPFRSPGAIRVPDLRAGLACIIAAAIAEGTTDVVGVDIIERGYGDIVPKLGRVGLSLDRVANVDCISEDPTG